ncbi:MAG: guanine deaminase [Thermodesulfobacteriota bacterium]
MRTHLGRVFFFTGDPAEAGAEALCFYERGALVVDGEGRVAAAGPADALSGMIGATEVTDHGDAYICPGFVDCHIHFPQAVSAASFGGKLLDWLSRHIYRNEEAFADRAFAQSQAEGLFSAMLASGTTSAALYGSVHEAAVDELFSVALSRNQRVCAGKMLMDRNLPEGVTRDTPESATAATERLIGRWHGKGRLCYAVSPRFAVAASDKLLQACGEILARHPNVLCQTHVSENPDEAALVARLFPGSGSYLSVYQSFELLGPRTVLGHAIHFTEEDFALAAQTGAVLVSCPDANFLLGSGVFDWAAARKAGVRLGLGSDVGAGSSLCMLAIAREALKASMMGKGGLDVLSAWYLITLGNARALGWGERIGSFAPSREADFVVLSPEKPPLLPLRMAQALSVPERLAALLLLGNEATVHKTFILGRQVQGPA